MACIMQIIDSEYRGVKYRLAGNDAGDKWGGIMDIDGDILTSGGYTSKDEAVKATHDHIDKVLGKEADHENSDSTNS